MALCTFNNVFSSSLFSEPSKPMAPVTTDTPAATPLKASTTASILFVSDDSALIFCCTSPKLSVNSAALIVAAFISLSPNVPLAICAFNSRSSAFKDLICSPPFLASLVNSPNCLAALDITSFFISSVTPLNDF